MLTTTLAEIKAHKPCTDGWAKLRKNIGPRKPLSTVVTLAQILESNGMGDAIWALRAFPENKREVRLFACACACRVAHLQPDVRVRRAILSVTSPSEEECAVAVDVLGEILREFEGRL